MFGKPIRLFTLFGFAIKLDWSWFIAALLIVWSLASAVFPAFVPDLAAMTYWWMGVAGALGLFASIVLHEIGHAVVARHYGLPMRGITLFIFGGVAEMEDEPQSPMAEFLVAIAGPLVSVAIALALYGLTVLGQYLAWPSAATVVLFYLAMLNAVVVIFNLIPAFPLDGGRVLRSVLWKWKGSLRKATRITSRLGSAFGFLLIAWGILNFFLGNIIGGIWIGLVGLFLRNAAAMSYQQLLVRQSLEGEPVSRFMVTHPVTVPPHITVQQLVDDYLYRYYYKLFPVVDESRLIGCVTMNQIKDLPNEQWQHRTVESVMERCNESNTIHPDTDAMEALSQMSRGGRSRIMVIYGDQLLGILTLKDMLRFLSMKVDLEEDESALQRPSTIARQTSRYQHASAER